MKKKRRNQNVSWHFKIFGTLVITFFFYSPLKKINGHNIREKKNPGGSSNRLQREVRKSSSIFFFFVFFFFSWFFFPRHIKGIHLHEPGQRACSERKKHSFTIHCKIKQGSFLLYPSFLRKVLFIFHTFLEERTEIKQHIYTDRRLVCSLYIQG